MLKEFRKFLQQGNVIDLAMAVIIGGAFGAIVNSLVDDIFMPVIGILIGGIDFSGLSIQVGEAVILFGNFIQAIINFVIIASAMFLVIRSYNQLRSEEQSAPPKPSAEEKILAEIRDLLKERKL
jgi:large conductance mechanosensitive channel